MKETSIYIHIPFCDHKCIYCDFYSIISLKNLGDYFTALKKEISYFSNIYSNNRKIISLYFGGGTPSLIEPKYIDDIINFISKKFFLSTNIEITLETNPGTVNKNKLKEFRKSGVNRISIGVQSFNDDELKFLTRIHDSDTAIKTVWDAYESEFDNISVDLIFNLPGQTKKLWRYNLETAIKLPIKHISTYSLIIERGTILNKMVLDGKVKIQDKDFDGELYEFTIDFLTHNGFIQYEVSNFAKDGFECVHNNSYWRYKDYFGFGTSSHSFIDGKRWWNYSSLNLYCRLIKEKNIAIAGEELLTPEQMRDEFIMLSLRSKGININEFVEKFGDEWIKKRISFIDEIVSKGFLIYENNLIKLTKRGYPLCDEIVKELL